MNAQGTPIQRLSFIEREINALMKMHLPPGWAPKLALMGIRIKALIGEEEQRLTRLANLPNQRGCPNG